MEKNQLEKAKKLIQKFQDGTISSEEELLLLRWLNQYQTTNSSELTEDALKQATLELQENLEDQILKTRSRTLVKPQHWVAACFLILCCAAGLYYMKQQTLVQHDHDPAQMKAILILEDGSEHALVDIPGDLINTNGYTVRQTTDSGLIYMQKDPGTKYAESLAGVTPTNTLVIPRGGQFKLTLPDGSLVWLNSDSRITYPVQFKDIREVKITGEAYFQVKHDTNRPFKVHAGLQLIEVLGTEFNVNAYPERQKTQTVLVSGSVKVASEKYPHSVSTKLKPGQMAEMNTPNVMVSTDIQVEKYTAWRNGDFHFEEESLSEIMDILSRWYNVKIVYEEGFKNDAKFGGVISRNKKLSAVIQMLESTGNVKFKITDKEVVLMN